MSPAKKQPSRSSRSTTATSTRNAASTSKTNAGEGSVDASKGENGNEAAAGAGRMTRRSSRARSRASTTTTAAAGAAPPATLSQAGSGGGEKAAVGTKRKRGASASPRVTTRKSGPAPTVKPLPKSRPRGRAAIMAEKRAAARAAKAASKAAEEASLMADEELDHEEKNSNNDDETGGDKNQGAQQDAAAIHVDGDDDVSDLGSESGMQGDHLSTPKARNSLGSRQNDNSGSRVIDRVPFENINNEENDGADNDDDVNSSSTYTLTATVKGKVVGVRVLFPVEEAPPPDPAVVTAPAKSTKTPTTSSAATGASSTRAGSRRRRRATAITKKSDEIIELDAGGDETGELKHGEVDLDAAMSAESPQRDVDQEEQQKEDKGRQLPSRRARGAAGSATRSTTASSNISSTSKRTTRGGSRRGGTRNAKGKTAAASAAAAASDIVADPVTSSKQNTQQQQQLSFPPEHLGFDGNLYYCVICKDVGDVVCCDGCPNVFHRACVPKGPSKQSLDNDDDPWYCPGCFPTKKGAKGGGDGKTTTKKKATAVDKKESIAVTKEDIIKGDDCDTKEEKSDDEGKNKDFKMEDIAADLTTSESLEEDKKEKDHQKQNKKSPQEEEEEEEMHEEKEIKIKVNVRLNDETHDDTQTTTATTTTASIKEITETSPLLRRGRSRDRRSSAKRCIECQKSGGNMEKCEGCGVFLHFNPSCRVEGEDGVGSTSATESEHEDDLDSDNSPKDKKGLNKSKRSRRRPLCSNCTAERVVEEEIGEMESARAADGTALHESSTKKNKKAHDDNADEFSTSDLGDLVGDDEIASASKRKRKSRKKRRRSLSPTSYDEKRERKKSRKSEEMSRLKLETDGEYVPPKEEHRKKKKKKKRKHADSPSRSSKSPTNEDGNAASTSTPPGGDATRTSPLERPVKSTPALFFFLADKRLLIERALNKKNRQFRKLPRGLEKNEHVAREGLIWWSELDRAEKAHWIQVSMQDFEYRIIEWKEEESIRLMLEASKEMERNAAIRVENEVEEGAGGSGDGGGEIVEGGTEGGDEDIPTSMLKAKEYIPPEDEAYLYHRQQRLYTSTSIDSKRIPRNPSDDSAKNTVLLELLKDLRFHPLPLVHPTRSKSDLDSQDFSKMTIPYFSVQGPLQTSVGDECLGCTRGWNHICPVLKKQFPAVEHRAKLQPPVSSLVACRIGLGLKMRQKEENAKSDNAASSGESLSPNGKNKSSPTKSFYLSQPSTRTDDVVQFMEEAIAVNRPPPDPVDAEGSGKKSPTPAKTLSRGALPTRGRKKRGEVVETSTPENDEDVANSSGEGAGAGNLPAYGTKKMYKCGRCGTITHTNKGCVTCRRKKLIVEMAERLPLMADAASNKMRDVTDHESSTHGAGFLKVHTVMLGRAPLRDANFEIQKEGDRAVADAMTNTFWKPNVIMPPESKATATMKPPVSVSPPSANDNAGELSTERQRNTFRPIKDVTPSDSDSDAFVSAATSRDTDKTDHLLARAQNALQKEGHRQALPLAGGGTPVDEHNSASASLASRGLRQRSGRASGITITRVASDLMESPDRQELAEAHKEEANKLQQRCFNVAVCGVLLGLMRRDPLRLFAEPVPENVPGYRKVVARPMDFGAVRKKVLGGEYSSFGAFVNDARLVCINALCYNPPGSIYWRTAKELHDALDMMQKRASNWMAAIKNAHASFFSKQRYKQQKWGSGAEEEESQDSTQNDPFRELRISWPGATELLENGDWLRAELEADFFRTKENEGAYYGCLAVRRAAAAAETTLAKSLHSGGIHQPSVRRTYEDDESLRNLIDDQVSKIKGPVQLRDEPNWREEPILKLLRRVRKRRVEGRTSSESGCARCDTMRLEEDAKLVNTVVRRKYKRKLEVVKPRIATSRLAQSTGLASIRARDRVAKQMPEAESTLQQISDTAMGKAVSVRGSRIHGWGLFADHPFKKGEVVAEYVGEYISNPVADAREKYYQERRIQDYQFRVDGSLVIDATLKGGHARYINHNCNPNCIAKIIDGEPPNKHLKRVIIVSQRDVQAREEITYDYQFPLELDLDARIPCTCGSRQCRGFMNWDLPEKGSNRSAASMTKGSHIGKAKKKLSRPKKYD